ncbi:resolvase [Chitinophaga sp. SYP-B3965]|uniref:recombinase family protein n=1 Tax=Chitinophaga sp. SYP-B3965 TaxID=2663120 RepID=UPI001299BDF1|nr:recombinase family protein [Chitinophaga sp. SYP-B3965]MRG48293.1 resolvase [Chitinophaga sp. SYP-B3965]
MRKAVTYLRVSTRRQGKTGYGLGAQRTAVNAYIQSQGMIFLKQFKEVESGRTSKRRELQAALAYCKEHGALLVIAKLDRLARNVAFIAALMESGVEFVAVDNPHATPLLIHVMAAFAQDEWEKASIRTREALADARKKGVKLGTNGKRLSQHNKERRQSVQKRVSPIIRLLREKGSTVKEITEYLNKRRIAPFRGKYFKWHLATVHGVIARL